MLEAVGNGIAMGNASEILKSVAEGICGDVKMDGIYHYFVDRKIISEIDR